MVWECKKMKIGKAGWGKGSGGTDCRWIGGDDRKRWDRGEGQTRGLPEKE